MIELLAVRELFANHLCAHSRAPVVPQHVLVDLEEGATVDELLTRLPSS